MTQCRKARQKMIEALSGELNEGGRELFEAHLRTCSRCRREMAESEAALEFMNRRVRPEPGQEFWDRYWDNLRRRALVPEAKDRVPRSFLPRWAVQAGAAVLLLAVGIFLGRFFPLAPKKTVPRGNQVARVRTESDPGLVLRAENVVDRSKVILLALVNTDPGAGDLGLNFPAQQLISRDLVREASLIKGGLEKSDRRLEELIADLELILLQIANLETSNDIEAIELIREGIDRQEILMKINLFEIRRGFGADRPPAPAAVRSQPI